MKREEIEKANYLYEKEKKLKNLLEDLKKNTNISNIELSFGNLGTGCKRINIRGDNNKNIYNVVYDVLIGSVERDLDYINREIDKL